MLGASEAMTSVERPVSVAPVGLVCGAEDEGDEGGAGFDDGVVELAGEVVAEGGCAEFGDGEAAGGDDEGLGEDGAGGGFDLETGLTRDRSRSRGFATG